MTTGAATGRTGPVSFFWRWFDLKASQTLVCNETHGPSLPLTLRPPWLPPASVIAAACGRFRTPCTGGCASESPNGRGEVSPPPHTDPCALTLTINSNLESSPWKGNCSFRNRFKTRHVVGLEFRLVWIDWVWAVPEIIKICSSVGMTLGAPAWKLVPQTKTSRLATLLGFKPVPYLQPFPKISRHYRSQFGPTPWVPTSNSITTGSTAATGLGAARA